MAIHGQLMLPLILSGANQSPSTPRFAVEPFLHGDVRHGGRWRRANGFSPGEIQITSPGRISSIGPPQRCVRPVPTVTINVWQSGCVCQGLRPVIPSGPE